MNRFFAWMLGASLMLCSSCYRAPTADDYSLIPSTNNPDYTHERMNGMPGVGY